MTIHCSPLELDLNAMRTQPPDVNACRQLFTELEFTTLLKELAPAEAEHPVEYMLNPSAEQVATFIAQARQNGFAFALPTSELEAVTEQISEQEAEAIEEREPQLKTMSLLDFIEATEQAVPEKQELQVAVAASAEQALLLPLEAVKSLLEDASVPKCVHDLKGAMRVLERHGVSLTNAPDDLMLYSYRSIDTLLIV